MQLHRKVITLEHIRYYEFGIRAVVNNISR